MRPSVAKLLNKTWAPVFYEQVFCKINEDLFAPMYSLDNGRPNTPVNILMSLEILKHMFGYNDQELLEQFYFNFQVNYALGIRNLGE
ncbi:MAG TPA: DDE transposase, partial [Syntrophomonas sp.]|nr:DDE transposase [Syntrophomonas sp.]